MSESSKRKRRWFQYSLRGLLVATTVVAVWLGVTVTRVSRLKQTLSKIEQLGGSVMYAHQLETGLPDSEPPGPAWLRGIIGDDYFRTVVVVRLRKKPVTDALLHRIGELHTVEHLDVSNCEVTDNGLHALAGLKELRRLDISFIAVTDAGLTHVQQLKHLERLTLDATAVTDEGVGMLKPLKKLQRLSLYGVELTDIGARYLGEMPSLEVLDLGKTHVGDEGLRHLLNLPKLTFLRLDTSGGDSMPVKITDKGLEHIGQMQNLTHLRLANHQFTDRGLVSLHRLSKLQSIYVFCFEPMYTKEGLSELKKALPTLQVYN